jgi:hypothetical protein
LVVHLADLSAVLKAAQWVALWVVLMVDSSAAQMAGTWVALMAVQKAALWVAQ